MQIDKVYITKSNFRRIIAKIDLSIVSDDILDNSLHEKFNFEFFSKPYIKRLLAFKYFIQHSQEIDFYDKAEIRRDTFTYLVENESKPSYHKYLNCERMNTRFENLEIPASIQDLGEEKVNEFRKYILIEFGTYEPKKFKEREDLIISKIKFKFGVNLNSLNFISVDFAGAQLQANMSLEDLESEIEVLLSKYHEACKHDSPIFPKFSKSTYLWKKPKKINYYPDRWYTREDFIGILKKIDLEIVEPSAELLREYFKVKFNKDLCFSGLLLNQLNFKPCNYCFEGGDLP
jgi:hypothetical protein